MTSRRRFLSFAPLLGAATFASAAPVDLDPKDPQAAALGYVTDATKVDKAKFPKYAAGQACEGCALYQGAAAAGGKAPCLLYGGKLVPAKAWCNAYVKKT